MNTLELMQFGDLHVCLHAYFSGSRSMTKGLNVPVLFGLHLPGRNSSGQIDE